MHTVPFVVLVRRVAFPLVTMALMPTLSFMLTTTPTCMTKSAVALTLLTVLIASSTHATNSLKTGSPDRCRLISWRAL